MARATRSSVAAAADLKRKRSPDDIDDDDAPAKLPRTDHPIDGTVVLNILQQHDTQGLLDRVFPPDECSSLRSLLSAQSTFNTLKAAIEQLRPISAIPRATLSTTAQEQQRFCDLAFSLIDQAYVPPHPIDMDAVFDTDEPRPQHRPKPSYALVQHLPSGDYWTSIANIDDPSAVQTGNAELVAIFPSPAVDKQDVTLGSYSRPLPPKKPPLQQRKVSTGAFLDYGPYASFAPCFDQENEVVGRRELGEVLSCKEERRRCRQEQIRERLEGIGSIEQVPDTTPQIDPSLDAALDALLAPEDIEAIKSVLTTYEFEQSVQRLLEQNQRALLRLEELQRERMLKQPNVSVEEGSEEWDTAQSILDSLTVLSALRPRTSSHEGPAIIPPASVLHKLHQTLLLEPKPSWHGTLPASRTMALRDDSTVKIRPGVPSTPAPAASVATPSVSTPVASSNPFGGYAYAYTAGQQQAYRPTTATSFTPYKPGQATAYYPNYATQPVQQQQGYYPQTAYGTANQQPYGAATGGFASYGWYGQYPSASTAAAGSGRGTPQPVVTTPAAMATTYGSFFSQAGATGTATPSRPAAVANTVVANTTTPYAQGSGAVPTLPLHLRTMQNPGVPQQNYYAVPQQTPAR